MTKKLTNLQSECQKILQTQYQYKSRLAMDLLAIIRPQIQPIRDKLIALVLQTKPEQFCDCSQGSQKNRNSQPGMTDNRYNELVNLMDNQIKIQITKIFINGGTLAEKSDQTRRLIFSHHDFDEQAFVLLTVQYSPFIPYYEIPRIPCWQKSEIKNCTKKVEPLESQITAICKAPQYQNELEIAMAFSILLDNHHLSEKEKVIALAFMLYTYRKLAPVEQECQKCPIKNFTDFDTPFDIVLVSNQETKTPEEQNSSSPQSFDPSLN